ncbi:MAG: hypothetical protein H8E55_21145 [Pelagibacterales bacterium]|nr:hypothetical protein [Pelagibacterales bacterium]
MENLVAEIKRKVPNGLRVNLCSIPPENIGPLTRKRTEGPYPMVPNTAVLSICKHMERNGYSKDHYDFYDLEMIYPTDEEIKAYYKS